MKKIIIIATHFPPTGSVGVVRITKFAKYLKLYGYEITIITISLKYTFNYDEGLLKDIENLKIYRIDFKNRKNTISKSFTKKLKKEIFDIIQIENPDFILETGGPFEPLIIGYLIYKKNHIPYIVDLRDPWTLQKEPKLKGIKKIRYKLGHIRANYNERRIFSKAKYILLVNSEIKNNYIKKYGKFLNKFKVISNGYDTSDYNDIKKINLKKFNICYAGKYSTSLGERNPEIIFKIIKKLNDNNINVNFLSIGNIEEEIVKLAKKYDCDNYCSFLGFKSFQETLSYQCSSDINIVFTTNEKTEQTGKIFNLINLKRPIIIISNVESNLTKLVANIDYIKIFKYSEFDKIYDFIKETYNNGIDNFNYENSPKIKAYTRENLTKKLIKLIEE